MPVRRQPRDHEGIGSLRLLSELDSSGLDFAAAAERKAGEAGSVEDFASRLAAGARSSISTPSRMHGLRVESMFRAVLVAIGSFQLLVEEDEGEFYFDDELGPVKSPDFRAVDGDGQQLLIEVKSVSPTSTPTEHSITSVEMEGLRRYGELTGAPVSIAHYWSGFNRWTLVDLESLGARGSRRYLELTDAVQLDQMARFGDCTIATVPPLELRLDVEEIGERRANGSTRVEIQDVQLLAAGEPLENELEQRIAFRLFRFGGWAVEMPTELDSAGRVASFSLRAEPDTQDPEAREEVERQGFAFVSSLSSIYSAMFNEITLDDEGAVRRLDHHSEPGELGSLIPDDYFERPDRQLRLWVFRFGPTASGDA